MVENLEDSENYKEENKNHPKSHQLEKIAVVFCYISFQAFFCVYEHRCYAYGEYTHIITDLGETVNIEVHKSFL